MTTEGGSEVRFTSASDDHLDTAIRFARFAKGVEKNWEPREDLPENKTHDLPDDYPRCYDSYEAYLSFCRSSIVTSFLFIESFINDIRGISEARKYKENNFEPFENSDKWELISGKALRDNLFGQHGPDTVEQYQAFLTVFDKKLFDKGKKPYEPVNFLRKLRNRYIHSEPVLVKDGEDTKSTEDHLMTYLNEGDLNPYAAPEAPFYPTKCTSYGCAKWALESACDFTNDFCNRMGLSPPYFYTLRRQITAGNTFEIDVELENKRDLSSILNS